MCKSQQHIPKVYAHTYEPHDYWKHYVFSGDYGIYATENLSNINQVANTGSSTITNRQLQLSDYALEIGLSRYF